jgi:hypothetical protein
VKIDGREYRMKSNLASDYLNEGGTFGKQFYEYIRPESETRLFHGGEAIQARYSPPKYELVKQLKAYAREAYISIKLIKDELYLAQKLLSGPKKNIISSGYFSIDTEFERMGYQVFRAPWVYNRKSKEHLFPSYRLFKAINDYDRKIKNTQFYELVSPKTHSILSELKEVFATIYKNSNLATFVCASCYPVNDRLSIDVMNEIGRRSFSYQHGLPGVYEGHMKYYDGTYDLIVWGQAFKDKYVSLGMNPNMIHVGGHSWYKNFEFNKLKFDLNDVLVISKSAWGIRVDSSDQMGDNSASLLYLLSIQNVLKKLGVKRVRLRVHPSESKDWYRKFLDPDFFSIDNIDLQTSFGKSTLVIGPTSSTFIDATYYGVNYLVYEPTLGLNKDLFKNPIVFPFDGTDERVVVAYNEEELLEIIKEKRTHDLSFWPDYVQTPFDLNSAISRI